MEIIYPRGAGRHPAMIVFDEFEYDSEMDRFCRLMLRKQLNKPLNYTGGYKMDDKKELLKDLIKIKANDELELHIPADPIIWDEVIEKMKDLTQNPVKRKKQLMRLEKEMLVDMVFDLESRNETLVNNLIEVEKMYNDLKGGNGNG